MRASTLINTEFGFTLKCLVLAALPLYEVVELAVEHFVAQPVR